MGWRLFTTLLVFLLAMALVTSKDISKIEPMHAKDVSYKIYETVIIYPDHTENEWFISTNVSSELPFSSKNSFAIWDLDVYLDGERLFFDPRPKIDLSRPDSEYKFIIPKLFNDSKRHDVMISFSMNNIKPASTWVSWLLNGPALYPFDRYDLFMVNRTIPPDMYLISSFEFPVVTLKGDLSQEVDIPVWCPGLSSPLQVNMPGILITLNQRVITADLSLKDFTSSIYPRLSETAPKVLDLKASCSIPGALLSTPLQVNRRWFPAKYLFTLFVVIFSFITHHWYKKNKPILETLYEIYVGSTITFVIMEFAVGILPPSRPSDLTLFDALILWPLICYLIFIICGYVKKRLVKALLF